MTTRKMIRVILVSVMVISCCSCSKLGNQTPKDELPMFGAKARTAEERQKDSLFVQEAIKEAGSKEAALKKLLITGFDYFRKSDFRNAMKTFNQAWLIAPENADVFWGFGDVLGVQGDLDGAIKMFKEAIKLSPGHVRAITDLAYAYQQKAYAHRTSSRYLSLYAGISDRLFEKASKIDPRYEVCFSNWAITLYLQGRYREAWEKIALARKLGGRKIDKNFLKDLSQAMPEPAS